MLHSELPVINKLGLHARAAAKVVSIACRHDVKILLRCNGREVEARNMMGVMTLAAAKGSSVQVSVEGEQASAALAELTDLFARRFDEEE
ncbi:HPr family phosphocarrier protein [Alcanivorax sp. JB21]|uniref:HPr family phosphocarrier protein n=1 Tax=Alcanivorax limicola TaxID=2874102 RepID=UPI001CC0AE84|nr:HPr family phosphocarrier protein [Alcanivorax limicola]MBZ2189613.1 HPr family phosphocarrier protein [Alcanivorax limicola]